MGNICNNDANGHDDHHFIVVQGHQYNLKLIHMLAKTRRQTIKGLKNRISTAMKQAEGLGFKLEVFDNKKHALDK